MTGKKQLSLLIRSLLSMLIGLCVVQCGVKQPAVQNKKFANPVADHTRFTDPCSSCHESTRLGATKDLVTVPHGFGRDCAECHEYLATGPSWGPKAYTHNPTPKACLGCHSLPGEMSKFGKTTAHGGGQLRGDCAPCHQDGTGWDVKQNK